jgi:hypothetical protein
MRLRGGLAVTDSCVCGHPAHEETDCPVCGCSIYELDNGTDHSPTSTGAITRNGIFSYDGRYKPQHTVLPVTRRWPGA